MMADSVVRITEGVIGSGKSVRVVWWLVDDFLPNNPDGGLFISNVPINPEAVARYVEKKHGLDYGKTLARLVVIPQDVLESWERGISEKAFKRLERYGGAQGEPSITPYDYFTQHNLAGAHIALDEAQNYWGRGRDNAWIDEMRSFVSRIRHFGATIELITQDEMQIALEVTRLASKGLLITPNEARRLPFLRIRLGDLYELYAKLGGRYDAVVAVQERIKVGKKWKNEGDPVIFHRRPEYFELYNSHGAVAGGLANGAPIFEYQKRSWPSLLWWFCRRNMGLFIKTAFLTVALAWLFLFGGFDFLNKTFISVVMAMVPQPTSLVKAELVPAGEEEEETTTSSNEEKPPPDPAVMMLELKAALEAAQARNVELSAETRSNESRAIAAELAAQRLRDRVEKESELAILDRECAVFRSGEIVRLNGKVRYGNHQGKTISTIDYDAGAVLFDDGSRVVLRMRREPPPSQTESPPNGHDGGSA